MENERQQCRIWDHHHHQHHRIKTSTTINHQNHNRTNIISRQFFPHSQGRHDVMSDGDGPRVQHCPPQQHITYHANAEHRQQPKPQSRLQNTTPTKTRVTTTKHDPNPNPSPSRHSHHLHQTTTKRHSFPPLTVRRCDGRQRRSTWATSTTV